jgi:integrase
MLPNEYGSPEFIRAWEAWTNGARYEPGKKRLVPGTVNALIAGYYESHDFKRKGEGTKRLQRSHLERFRQTGSNGDASTASLTSANIRKLLDKRADKPASANNFLKVMRALCRYGVERGLLKENGAASVRRVRDKTDGHLPWTDEQIEAFEARHPVGTKANLAMRLMLYTAQRRSDAIRMGKQNVKDGWLIVRQQKTGQRVEIPILPILQEAIDNTPCGDLTFLVTSFGKGFSMAGFGNWFRDRCNEAGLHDRSAHGLRKSALTRLADAGMTTHQIASISGHKSLAEVERYTRAANQKRLAKQAIEGLNREHEIGKPLSRFAYPEANPLKTKG